MCDIHIYNRFTVILFNFSLQRHLLYDVWCQGGKAKGPQTGFTLGNMNIYTTQFTSRINTSASGS